MEGGGRKGGEEGGGRTESTRNEAPHSAATARASIVLPVPGGPNSSTPRHGALSRRLRKKRSGCSSGSCTASRSASFAFSSAPTCAAGQGIAVTIARQVAAWAPELEIEKRGVCKTGEAVSQLALPGYLAEA